MAVEDRPWLYRLAGPLSAGVPLAAGSDAPFGDANPWAAMQAAVDRRSADGQRIGADEALTPDQALVLFLSPPAAPGAPPPRLAVGAVADLCLLQSPWRQAARALSAVRVRQTWRDGQALLP